MIRRIIITAALLSLFPLSALAEPGENGHEWEFRIGPRVGATALNAEGYGRNVEFDQREWGFGFLIGAEVLWRYEASPDSFAFGVSLSQLVSKRSFGGIYEFEDEPVDISFYAFEWQAMARLSFPALLEIQPFVSAGLFAYLPQKGWTEGDDLRDLQAQIASPQVGVGLEFPVASSLFVLELTYQRSGVLPFSYSDGYTNGFDGGYLSVSALF